MLGKFFFYSHACHFQEHCKKATAIILGDDGMYWVVNLAAMEKLIKQGYEVAK